MAEIGIIFTTDYEIFGNGSGSVEHCMLRPTELMATALEDYGARLTLFVDICEYWAFEAEFAAGNLKEDWAGQIRNQLQQLTQRGHDVQLHFHPQWLDYQYDGEHWQLNYDLWRISNLKYEDDQHPERGLLNLFRRAKADLEHIIGEVKPDYRCEIFRAGAWSMQPEGEVLRAMRECGFRIDSTVAPGLHFKDQYTYYDFSSAPDGLEPYNIHDKISTPAAGGGLLEMPIFTHKISRFRRARFLRLRQKRQLAMKPPGCSGSALASLAKSKWQKIRENLAESRLMFTFGDATPYEQMAYMSRKALKMAAPSGQSMLPVVAISHPKTFAQPDELRKFLQWASKHGGIHFKNYSDFIT